MGLTTSTQLLDTTCSCGIEIDGQGVVHHNHDKDCKYGQALAEQERLSWILAGVSTAVLGYLKPEEEYAGRPISQIEEAVILRTAFGLACEALKPFFSTARQNHLATNDLMVEFLRAAEKRISEIRSAYVPGGRAHIN